MITQGNLKFFCENCENYIESREEYFHKNECPGNKLRTGNFSSDIERRDRSNYFSKNENRNDHYSLREGLMTFGRSNQRLNEMVLHDKNQFVSSKSQFHKEKEEFSESLNKKDFKYDTFKNFNNNLNDNHFESFKQSNAFRQSDFLPLQKQSLKNNENNGTKGLQSTATFLRKSNPFINAQNTIKEYDENDKIIKENRRLDSKDFKGAVGFTNSKIDNNSFLIVVIQALWNMKAFRKYILNSCSIRESDNRYKLIYSIKYTFQKYSEIVKNKQKSSNLESISIEPVRVSLAELFQSRRKFLLEHPDDPVDALFSILNSNEISEESCNFECVSHQLFWIDLFRLDECECGSSSKKLFSYHNYIFDIQFDKIFENSDIPQSVEFGKRIKLKSGKLGNENGSLNDFKGKLFICLNNYLAQIKFDCPSGKCTQNQTHKTFTLSNLPTYFMVNLQNKNMFNNSALDVLKSLILIPGLFDISTIFEYKNEKKKIFYEFLGGISNDNSKSFTAFFLQQNDWIHYNDDKIVYYKNWYELIIEMVKNQEMPMFLVFQKQENFEEINLSLLNDEVLKLERFARNIDNIPQIFLNKFRPYEDISKIDTISVDTIKTSVEQNKYKRVLKSNESSGNLEYYNCSICNFKNRIDNVKCLKCEKNNEIIINQLMKNTNKKLGNGAPSGEFSIKKSNFTNELNSTMTNTFAKNTHYESKSKGFYKNDNDSNTNEKYFKDELKDTLKSFETPEFPEEKIRNSNAQKPIPSFKENNFFSDKGNKFVMTLCRICGSVVEKCQCKITTNNEKPPQKAEDKLRKKNSNEWECEQCKFINSNLLNKCKLCKATIKPNTQQSTTMNTKEANQISANSNGQMTNIKLSEEKSKNLLEGNQNNQLKNVHMTSKDIPNNSSQNKCICYVIDNDSLFTNNACRLCKRTRNEKGLKQPPKKTSTNTIEIKSSRDYQLANQNNPQNNTSHKAHMVKSGSKDINPINDMKRLEVKKNQFESNETRNSKNMLNQGKINPNIKGNLNKDLSSNESNNPFKKTIFNQHNVQAVVNNQGVKRSPFKEIEVKNYNNVVNSKNTLSKQRYNDFTSQKLK